MVIGATQNFPSIYLKLPILKSLNFIGFGTGIILENELHHKSLKPFQFNNVPIQPHYFYQERSDMFILSA